MAHQPGKGARVGLDRILAEGRYGVDRPSIAVPRPEKAPLITLDPVGHIGRLAVLPQPEPQKRQPHGLAPRLIDQRVEQFKVEFALARLYELPVNRRDDGVHIERPQIRPDAFLHILCARGAGVVDLAGEEQHGTAVHGQLPAPVRLFNAGKFLHVKIPSYPFITVLPLQYSTYSPAVSTKSRPVRGKSNGANRIYISSLICAPSTGGRGAVSPKCS